MGFDLLQMFRKKLLLMKKSNVDLKVKNNNNNKLKMVSAMTEKFPKVQVIVMTMKMKTVFVLNFSPLVLLYENNV
jgi:hypothetical protein